MHHTGIGFIEVMKSVNTIYIGDIRIIDFPSYQYCLLVNALKRDVILFLPLDANWSASSVYCLFCDLFCLERLINRIKSTP